MSTLNHSVDPPYDGAGINGVRVLDCEEQGPVNIALSDLMDTRGKLLINKDVESGDYFSVTLRRGELTLRARGFIGMVPINENVVVRVRPRVRVKGLGRLVDISGHPPAVIPEFRAYPTEQSWSRYLTNVYAGALIRGSDVLSTNGLHQDYTRIEETTSVPRGRVNVHETLRRLHTRGIGHLVHTSRFERTPDVPVNKCIKYAIWTLCQRYIRDSTGGRRERRLHQRLVGTYHTFARVELDHSLQFLTDPIVQGTRPLPALRSYYRNVVDVSRSIVLHRGVSLDLPGQELDLPSIVINFNYVFEGYIRQILREHFASTSMFDAVDGNSEGATTLFNEHREPRATPDVVILERGGPARLVLEVKNVPVIDGSSRDAINQVVTYGVRFGLTRVLLVHPLSGSQSSHRLRLLGTVGTIEVWQYQIDLAAVDPILEERAFGKAVEGLL